MKPKNVLHILGSGERTATAQARVVLPLARGLDPQRFRLHAWFLAGEGPLGDEFQQAGIRVRAVPWQGARDLIGAWRFWQGLRAENFAILHQHYGGRSVRWLARLAGRPRILVHLHSRAAELESFQPVPQRALQTDVVIATSSAVAQSVVGTQARVIYPGVVVPESAERQTPSTPRATGKVVGTAGRLAPIKGIPNLILAIAGLRADIPDVRLEIAGAGPAQPSLERQVRELGLNDCVTFLGWQVDLQSVMSGWDVFVAPSLEEAFSISALEAMAAGLPVVASSVGGLPELVEDGCTGWLVPPGKSEALVARLRELLLNPDQRRAFGGAGRARARTHFSAERMVADISGIYDELLTRVQ
jgi:glycosyltransferase involved in cell wall biosynthesis